MKIQRLFAGLGRACIEIIVPSLKWATKNVKSKEVHVSIKVHFVGTCTLESRLLSRV
jgi:hypothetical protein